MNRFSLAMLRALLCTGGIVACLSSSVGTAQEVVVYPPDEFVATTAPVYFEGRPAYWWRGRWYYRDHASWGYYHDEPRYLHDWRGGHREGPARQFYGRDHGGGYRRR
jgi:hypothetical protein